MHYSITKKTEVSLGEKDIFGCHQHRNGLYRYNREEWSSI